MPISNNASYIPTINEFIGHWTEVNAVLPTPLVASIIKPVVLARSLSEFTTLRNDIQTQALEVLSLLNDKQIARGSINLQKTQVLLWINEFNGWLDAYYAGTPFLNARPSVPSLSDGEELFLTEMRDMSSLWEKLNAATAPSGITLPLLLSDGTPQASFVTATATLQQGYALEAKCKVDVTVARAEREQNKAIAYEAMKAYRVAVPTRSGQFPALVATLPRLTPEKGHTPEPVNASAVFEAPDNSKVVYDASADPALLRYELRGNPGTEYDDDDAVVILTNLPADPREFLTDFSLTQPGAQVALKVYVVLTTGNEAGSATMVVTRPV